MDEAAGKLVKRYKITKFVVIVFNILYSVCIASKAAGNLYLFNIKNIVYSRDSLLFVFLGAFEEKDTF